MSRVALIGENSIEYVSVLLDIWNSGDCAVLIDWRIPLHTTIEMMKEAGVSICYFEKTKYEIKESCYGIKFIAFERKSNSAQLLPLEIYDKFKKNYSKNEAIVLYSSGTTGKAKGIILSHYAINTNADAIIDYMKPTDNDCIYIAKVFSHSSTITGELLVSLKTRMKLVIAPTIVPPRFVLRCIEKFGISIICLNPTLLQKYAEEYDSGKYALLTLRIIYVSGSILSDNVYTAAHTAFKGIAIYNVYGLSEAGPRVTAQQVDCCTSNSVGKPIKGVEIQIVDDEGNPLKQGECGIIHVNTPSQFNGYITGNEKLRSFFKGWLNSGDIGYIDKYNELNIISRIDDVIIIDSHKIYPQSIVNDILKISDILDCVVFSIKDTCNNNRSTIICFYLSKSNDDLAETVRRTLLEIHPKYEVPDEFIRVSNLERNLSGKILKSKLIEQYLDLKGHKLIKF